MRGFGRQQVINYVEALQDHVAIAEADRAAELERVHELWELLGHLREQALVLGKPAT